MSRACHSCSIGNEPGAGWARGLWLRGIEAVGRPGQTGDPNRSAEEFRRAPPHREIVPISAGKDRTMASRADKLRSTPFMHLHLAKPPMTPWCLAMY